mmetsp:Transcript_82354/g.233318  ORF Transcript_82354/g.233318 Transcript_82354/m.233318 type:complete len:208 (-) Transcript_82354:1961-2584(-)
MRSWRPWPRPCAAIFRSWRRARAPMRPSLRSWARSAWTCPRPGGPGPTGTRRLTSAWSWALSGGTSRRRRVGRPSCTQSCPPAPSWARALRPPSGNCRRSPAASRWPRSSSGSRRRVQPAVQRMCAETPWRPAYDARPPPRCARAAKLPRRHRVVASALSRPLYTASPKQPDRCPLELRGERRSSWLPATVLRSSPSAAPLTMPGMS